MTENVIVLRDAEVDCELFTHREGVLSAAGHDLKLRASRSTWSFDLDAHTLDVRVDAAAISVVCARDGDRDAPGALSEGDRRKIDAALRDDVLRVKRFPEILARASWRRDGDRATLEGELTIAGVTRPFRAEARREGGRWSATYTVDQPDFGVRPFTALFGALKVRRDVIVRVALAGERVDGSV